MLPSPLTEDEICCFFAGLPSRPHLIARTGVPWKPIPIGIWQRPHARELRPVGKHAIAAPGVWENHVGPALLKVLDDENVQWNTIDVHRIHYVGFDHEAPFPVVVCIGVKLGLLSGEDGARVAERCQAVLDGFGFGDVEVAIKASERVQTAAPAFEKPTVRSSLGKDPVAQFCMPFTSSVGCPLSSVARPDVEGSGGFFFTNGEDTSKVFLLTTRHAVIDTTTRDQNVVYDHKASERPRRKDVTVFGEKGIVEHLKALRVKIGCQSMNVDTCQDSVEHVQTHINEAQGQDEELVEVLNDRQSMLKRAQACMMDLETLYVHVAKLYLSELGRLLGFVSYSPPLGFSLGEHKYTEDVAVIEVDANKIDPGTFRPNVLDLHSEMGGWDLKMMLNPLGWKRGDPDLFEYPFDLLLQLHDIIPDAELRDPTQRDSNGDRGIMVLKRGKTTGLTVGRLNNMPSYTRTYWEDGTSDVSMEWPIFNYGYELKWGSVFSTAGDSGSVVVDRKGRIAGIIAGAAGCRLLTDVTYMIPAEFIYNQMLARGIDMNVNFTLT